MTTDQPPPDEPHDRRPAERVDRVTATIDQQVAEALDRLAAIEAYLDEWDRLAQRPPGPWRPAALAPVRDGHDR